jgi:hypothetical protein
LLAIAPELAQYEADARSIAVHARWDWFSQWIGTSTDFRADFAAAADRHGLDPREVRHIAVTALLDAYRTTRARQERRATTGRQSTGAEHGQGQRREKDGQKDQRAYTG